MITSGGFRPANFSGNLPGPLTALHRAQDRCEVGAIKPTMGTCMKTIRTLRQQARLPTLTYAALFLPFLSAQPGVAGDRVGVTEVLQSIGTNWPDAQFSVDVSGLSDGDAVLGRPMKIEYEAAQKGYISYLRVSSHGDMTLFRTATTPASLNGIDSLAVEPPLGGEQMIVLYSSKPLTPLLPEGVMSVAIGADRAHAESLVRQIEHLKASGILLADRKYRYSVATAQGGTEYTTRSITLKVEGDLKHPTAGASASRVPSHVQFEFDSDRLTAAGKRDLDEFGEALLKLNNTTVQLEGHTDATGTDDYNMSLSQRRAEAARRYLVESFGLPDSRVTSVGKGKAAPLAPNDSESNMQQNRRVDFVFSSANGAP